MARERQSKVRKKKRKKLHPPIPENGKGFHGNQESPSKKPRNHLNNGTNGGASTSNNYESNGPVRSGSQNISCTELPQNINTPQQVQCEIEDIGEDGDEDAPKSAYEPMDIDSSNLQTFVFDRPQTNIERDGSTINDESIKEKDANKNHVESCPEMEDITNEINIPMDKAQQNELEFLKGSAQGCSDKKSLGQQDIEMKEAGAKRIDESMLLSEIEDEDVLVLRETDQNTKGNTFGSCKSSKRKNRHPKRGIRSGNAFRKKSKLKSGKAKCTQAYRNSKLRKTSDDKIIKLTRNGDLVLAYINANGLNEMKQDEVQQFLDHNKVDILCVTEHKNRDPTVIAEDANAKQSEHKGILFKGYSASIRYRTQAQGGVGIFWKENINAEQWECPIEDINSHTCNEKTWILIKNKENTIAIGTVYMGVQDNTDSRHEWNEGIYTDLAKDICELRKLNAKILLCGDFNGHISNGEDGIIGNHFGINPNGQRLIDFTEQNGLKNMNVKNKLINGTLQSFSKGIWTREFQSTKTIIDYLLVDESSEPIIKNMIIDDKRQFSIQSDHNWIVAVIDANYMRVEWPEIKKTRWKVNRLNKGGSKQFAKAFGELHDSTNSTNVEVMNNNILNSLNKAAEKVVGKTTLGNPKKKRLPQTVLEALKKWRQCEKEFAECLTKVPPRTEKLSRERDFEQVRNDSEIKKKLESLKSAKEELNKLRQDNHRKMHADLLGKIKCNGGVNSKEFWKAAKGDHRTTPINSLKRKDGSLTESVEATVERAAEYFNDLFKCKLGYRKRIKSSKKKINRALNGKFTIKEIRQHIKKLKNGKAVGPGQMAFLMNF